MAYTTDVDFDFSNHKERDMEFLAYIFQSIFGQLLNQLVGGFLSAIFGA